LRGSWRANDTLTLTDTERLHHLLHVLRIKKGDSLRIFNPTLGEWYATVVTISRNHLALDIGEKPVALPVIPQRQIHLACALLKRDAFEMVVEKATELGVATITPILSEYAQRRTLNEDRLRAIMVNSVEQCGGFEVPTLNTPVSLNNFLQKFDTNHYVYAALENERDITTAFMPTGNNIKILIGPEGGWSDSEVRILKTLTCVSPISLGCNILRAETAAIVACGIASIIR